MSVSRPVARGGLWGSHKFSGGLWRGGLWASQRLGFNPLSLFANGEQGAWYDPSDLTTLYQDSAGTTPVTADGDPVGLMLDKSQGLVLGPDIVTNGDFENGTTGWTAVSGASVSFSVSGGQAQFEVLANYAGAAVGATQDVITTAGKWYEATADVSSSGASAMEISAVDAGVSSNQVSFGSGKVRIIFRAADGLTTLRVGFSGTGESIGDTGTADNFIVREFAGNHASQSVAASRPIYRTDGTLHWLEFDGVDDHLTTPESQSQPYSRAAAFRATAPSDFIIDGNASNSGSISTVSGLRLYAGGAGFSAPYATGTDATFIADLNGSDSKLRINGATTTGVLGVQTITSTTIGASGASTATLLGRIYAIVSRQGIFLDSQAASLEKYLAEKAGVIL